jgi:signal transduction histidine kinase
MLEAEKKNTLLALAEQDSEKGFLTHQLQENFAQTLAATKLYLEFAEISADEANHFIQKSRDSITQVITEINQLCRSLAPATVGNPDMAEVLQDMVAEWQSQNSIYIDFICHARLDELKGHGSLALFHIIQQQLKMATYCQASEVEISLLEKDGIVIYFHINGMNFNDPDQKKELFINHIQNRVFQLGGELSFETNLDPNDVMLITIPACAKRHTRQAADEMELKSAKFV